MRISFCFKDYESKKENEIAVLMHGKSLKKFLINPYLVPSRGKTVHRFFLQLKNIPRLSMFADELPIPDAHKYEDEEYTTRRLYDFVAGKKEEEKKVF